MYRCCDMVCGNHLYRYGASFFNSGVDMSEAKDLGTRITDAFTRYRAKYGFGPIGIMLGIKERNELLDSGLDTEALGVNVYYSSCDTKLALM